MSPLDNWLGGAVRDHNEGRCAHERMSAMKRIVWAWALIVGTATCWCTPKKITVAQLEEMLHSMQQEKKSDAEVATALKQVELSQELTRSTMGALVNYAPGPQATEQIFILEAKSAELIPPDKDLPAMEAPAETAQKALLDKTAAYVSGVYQQLPSLMATKITLRLQDNVEALPASSGLQGGAQDATVSSGLSSAASFVHYINSFKTQVSLIHGSEKKVEHASKIPWGANKMIALQEPDPGLGEVFRQAVSSENIHWLRWEAIGGRSTAVFSFAVPRNKSHLSLDVCCFPNINQTGIATFYTPSTASTLGDKGATGGGVTGDFQTSTNWKEYKTTAPYHGEFFVDPESGIVLRMIVQSELKPTDLVHQLDTRVDFASVRVGAKTYVLPVKTYIDSLVVPNGDSGAATYTTRRTLFTSEYKDYESNPN